MLEIRLRQFAGILIRLFLIVINGKKEKLFGFGFDDLEQLPVAKGPVT